MRSFSLPSFVRAHRRTLIVIVGIALIPLIYAGSLIWSNEDPTHRLDHINAAIVNGDAPATPASPTGSEPAEPVEPVDLGATLTQKLVDSSESNNFSWHEMSADDAQAALESGEVLAVLEIPEGFSAAAVSAASDDPLDAAIARLSITTNDGANIIVGNIASTVGTTVADELAAEVSDEYLRNVYVGFTDIHDSIAEAADGATELNDGAEQARTGSGELVVGLGQLREGGLALADGSATLSDGASQVDAGVQQLSTGLTTANSGAQQLSTGAASANTGAQQLSTGAASANSGAQQLNTGLSTADSGAQLLSAGLADLNTQTTELPTKITDLTAAISGVDAGASAISGGVDTALVGATTLSDGAGALAAGTSELSGGINSLLANYDSLSDAERKSLLTDLATAGDQLNTGAGELSAGATSLVGDAASGTGLSFLQAKSTELAAGTGQLSEAATPLGGKVDELVAAISTASTKSAELAAGTQTLATGASTLATGTQTLAEGASTLATGTQTLADGASTLATGTETLATGASTLADSTPKLVSGAQQLETGATTLADGTADAQTGGTKLSDGITQLADGSKTLAEGLDDGVSSIPSYTDAQAEHLAGATSTPVEITKTRLNEVPAYGYGLAPYFMTLGLWVGALAYYLMFPALRERLVLGRQPAVVVALRSFAPGALLAAAQSLLMLFVVRFGLGLEPANMLGLIALALLTSVTFVAVNQAFNALLGPPGRFLALIMIVLQLSSAGGTYPVETAPAFFQLIHSWLPLNYAVTAFRSLVAGGPIGIGEAYGMLVVWLIAALTLTTLSIVLKRRRARLEPAGGAAGAGGVAAGVSPVAATTGVAAP